MRRAIVASTALLILGACGTDEGASNKPTEEYATGELPTADTVQRESDVHVASKQAGEGDERSN